MYSGFRLREETESEFSLKKFGQNLGNLLLGVYLHRHLIVILDWVANPNLNQDFFFLKKNSF